MSLLIYLLIFSIISILILTSSSHLPHRQFSPNQPCDSIYTDNFRFALKECEPNFWIVLVLLSPAEGRANPESALACAPYDEYLPDFFLQSIIKRIYSIFRLFNGKMEYVMKAEGRSALRQRVALYLSHFIPSFDWDRYSLPQSLEFNSNNTNQVQNANEENVINTLSKTMRFNPTSLLAFDGFQFLPASRAVFLTVQYLANSITAHFPNASCGAVFFEGKLLWTGLNQTDTLAVSSFLNMSTHSTSSIQSSQHALYKYVSENSALLTESITFKLASKLAADRVTTLCTPFELAYPLSSPPSKAITGFLTGPLAYSHLVELSAYSRKNTAAGNATGNGTKNATENAAENDNEKPKVWYTPRVFLSTSDDRFDPIKIQKSNTNTSELYEEAKKNEIEAKKKKNETMGSIQNELDDLTSLEEDILSLNIHKTNDVNANLDRKKERSMFITPTNSCLFTLHSLLRDQHQVSEDGAESVETIPEYEDPTYLIIYTHKNVTCILIATEPPEYPGVAESKTNTSTINTTDSTTTSSADVSVGSIETKDLITPVNTVDTEKDGENFDEFDTTSAVVKTVETPSSSPSELFQFLSSVPGVLDVHTEKNTITGSQKFTDLHYLQLSTFLTGNLDRLAEILTVVSTTSGATSSNSNANTSVSQLDSAQNANLMSNYTFIYHNEVNLAVKLSGAFTLPNKGFQQSTSSTNPSDKLTELQDALPEAALRVIRQIRRDFSRLDSVIPPLSSTHGPYMYKPSLKHAIMSSSRAPELEFILDIKEDKKYRPASADGGDGDVDAEGGGAAKLAENTNNTQESEGNGDGDGDGDGIENKESSICEEDELDLVMRPETLEELEERLREKNSKPIEIIVRTKGDLWVVGRKAHQTNREFYVILDAKLVPTLTDVQVEIDKLAKTFFYNIFIY